MDRKTQDFVEKDPLIQRWRMRNSMQKPERALSSSVNLSCRALLQQSLKCKCSLLSCVISLVSRFLLRPWIFSHESNLFEFGSVWKKGKALWIVFVSAADTLGGGAAWSAKLTFNELIYATNVSRWQNPTIPSHPHIQHHCFNSN